MNSQEQGARLPWGLFPSSVVSKLPQIGLSLTSYGVHCAFFLLVFFFVFLQPYLL